MTPAVNVFCTPTLDGDLATVEASLRKIKISADRGTRSATVKWGSSLKLNFDRYASPSWVGNMVSSEHFVQRYNESNDKQKRDILGAFPALARGIATHRATDLGLEEGEIPRLRVPPILKKQTRWSKKKPWVRPIIRERNISTAGSGSNCIQSCQETICWFGALSSPTLSLTDDESDDSTMLLGSSSDEPGDIIGSTFDPVVYIMESSVDYSIVDRVSL